MRRRLRAIRADQRGGVSMEYAIIFAVSVTLATLVGGLVVTRAETMISHAETAVQAECTNRFDGAWNDDTDSCTFDVDPKHCWDSTTSKFRTCTPAEIQTITDYLNRIQPG